jgi:hypothetical protein
MDDYFCVAPNHKILTVKKWCKNTPGMPIVVILSSNGWEETSLDLLLLRIKVI